MIEPTETEGGKTVLFTVAGGVPSYRPCSDFLHIEAQNHEMAGNIVLPQGSRAVDFTDAKVIKAGPECKWVKDGDRILVAVQAIMNIKHEGKVAQFTKESSLVTIIN